MCPWRAIRITVLAITSSLASASVECRAELPADIKSLYDAGIVANSQGQRDKAFDLFLQAHQQADAKSIFPTPEIYQQLGEIGMTRPSHELRALCWLGACLACKSQATDDSKIRNEIAALQKVSHETLTHLLDLTEEAGKEAAAKERARHNVEDSLDRVVYLWTEVQRFDRAQRVADTIQDAYVRSQSDERISYGQIDAGDFNDAREGITKAQKTVTAIEDPWWKDSVKLDAVQADAYLANGELKAGNVQGARRAIEMARQAMTIDNSYMRSQAYRSIAEAQAAAGDIAGAKESVMLIKGEDARADDKFDAQLAIAEAQVKAGDKSGAEETFAAAGETVKLIPQALSKYENAVQFDKQLVLAKTEAAAGEKTAARTTFASMLVTLNQRKEDISNLYFALGSEQAAAGDVAGATKSANTLQDDKNRSAMLDGIKQGAQRPPPIATSQTQRDHVMSWLWEIELGPMHNESQPEVDDAAHYADSDYLAKLLKNPNPEQKFADLTRASEVFMEIQKRIDSMLHEQFNL